MSTTRSWLPVLGAAFVVLLIASPANAATPDEAADALVEGVYVEAGATADAIALRQQVVEARTNGVELSVVVLSDDTVDAVGFANELGAVRTGTVMVFTPAQYGISSSELSQGQLDDAIDAASDDLSGLDVTAGVAAFVGAITVEPAEESSTNWPLLIGAGLLILVVVGVVGRMVERRSSSERKQKALAREWEALKTRADGLADPILDLSTPVDLLGDRDVTATYREASGLFDRVRRRVDQEPAAGAVDEMTQDMDRLDALVARIRAAVKPPAESPATDG